MTDQTNAVEPNQNISSDPNQLPGNAPQTNTNDDRSGADNGDKRSDLPKSTHGSGIGKILGFVDGRVDSGGNKSVALLVDREVDDDGNENAIVAILPTISIAADQLEEYESTI